MYIYGSLGAAVREPIDSTTAVPVANNLTKEDEQGTRHDKKWMTDSRHCDAGIDNPPLGLNLSMANGVGGHPFQL